jgi:hypothetical protein
MFDTYLFKDLSYSDVYDCLVEDWKPTFNCVYLTSLYSFSEGIYEGSSGKLSLAPVESLTLIGDLSYFG